MTHHHGHLKPGVHFGADGVTFAVVSQHATDMTLCLFGAKGDKEISRHAMQRTPGGVFTLTIPGLKAGARYGFRANGPWQPDHGHLFDPAKLLVDPHATRIDRPFRYHADLGKRGAETCGLVPKAVLEDHKDQRRGKPVALREGGLIYEVPVRAFSKLNPGIPEKLRGTLAAIAHPVSIAHFKKIGVAAVELMPITAWIDERHLAPLGLVNAWGYNPVTFMALDPRLAPNGFADLKDVADALHAHGIALFVDVVFNHSGESDLDGPVLSMRGLDNALYYRHHADEPGALVNDTGTGNTLAVDRAPVRELVLAALRHFVVAGGVDGFRFDLGVTLGRTERGFSPHAPLFEAMRHDPVLADCTMIGEPWDLGPDGYQLGNFPPQFLEWNDRYRDDVRRFWRGDRSTLGAVATRLAGSSDFFAKSGTSTRSVNFLAAHDGFTLADVTSHRRRHNYANGEGNRDGHGENFSWNHGHEGSTSSPLAMARRNEDVRAMLALLFVSRGTPMLTAGDEFGRTQHGNNNAYAQDNEVTWLNWAGRDKSLEDFVSALSSFRAAHPALMSATLLNGSGPGTGKTPDIFWFRANGEEMAMTDWENPESGFLGLVLAVQTHSDIDRVAVVINRNAGKLAAHAPPAGKGMKWHCALSTRPIRKAADGFELPPHSVALFMAKKSR